MVHYVESHAIDEAAVQISFDLSFKDFCAWQTAYNAGRRKIGKERFSLRNLAILSVRIALSFALGMLTFVILKYIGATEADVRYFILGFFFLLIPLTLIRRFAYKWKLRRVYNDMYQSRGPVRLRLQGGSIFKENDFISFSGSIAGIREAVEETKYYFIFFGDFYCFCIPRSAFASRALFEQFRSKVESSIR